MSTKLIFIRHGESEANRDGRFTGQSNLYGLTERGHSQAEAAGAFLAKEPVTAVYASDLRRAYDTALHAAKPHALSVISEKGLREIYAGEWEGKLFDELPALYPEDFGLWRTDIGRALCTGGESVAELYARVRATVEMLVKRHPGETLILATHATPIRVMQCVWQKKALCEMQDVPWVPNASITTVIYEDDLSFHDVNIGMTEHLLGMTTVLPDNV